MLKLVKVRVHLRDAVEARRISKRLKRTVLRFTMKFKLSDAPHPWEGHGSDFLTVRVMVLSENVKRMERAIIKLNKLREDLK